MAEVNERIKSLFELDPQLLSICVSGELSNYKIYPSGHHYFTIKDSTASLKCVMFKSAAMKLRFRPENGMQAILMGSINVYPRDGVYQLYVNSIMPEGQGMLQLKFEALKARLSEEGLFDVSHKKPLPKTPGRIAVVTSSAGAAVRDIVRILRERWPLSEVLIVPVRVQGVEAPGEIADAIDFVNRQKLADIIITGRGGGSIEDLWAFNEEIVARAIYRSVIPVISAVGHEPDVTISDYVADARASTPSNAAEIAVPDRRELEKRLELLRGKMTKAIERTVLERRRRLDNLRKSPCLTDSVNYINEKRMAIDSLYTKLETAERGKLTLSRHRLSLAAGKLEALSPVKVLGRGYTITTSCGDGHVITAAADVDPGESVYVRFSDGKKKFICEG